MEFLIGVDVGGTFTDGVVVDEKGNLNIFKVPTTNKKPSAGFMNCLRKAAEFYQVPFTEFLSHTHKLCWGTTIATNALIQGKVARTGLITTKGHRDALPIARISREYLDIDLQVEKPPSLIPRHMIEEIIERVDYKG
ncbi:MAG: hydantoinase/oxoprolinase N-terminal domain-containing protein, partial [Dehalococcoidia bacterium]|nr:hydantoinase/oxoprolinase N-terminal domain-containing protein [Dehalococcoidia bacterium]